MICFYMLIHISVLCHLLAYANKECIQNEKVKFAFAQMRATLGVKFRQLFHRESRLSLLICCVHQHFRCIFLRNP